MQGSVYEGHQYSAPTEIRRQYLQNTSQTCFCFTNLPYGSNVRECRLGNKCLWTGSNRLIFVRGQWLINRIPQDLRTFWSTYHQILMTQYSASCDAHPYLVEVLRYKPEGRSFVFRWCHWNLWARVA